MNEKRIANLTEQLRRVDRVKLAEKLKKERLEAELEPRRRDTCTNETMKLTFTI